MSLLERIKTDQAARLKQRNTVAAAVLDTVIGACKRHSKSMKPVRALTDGEVTAVVRAMIKRIDNALLTIADDPAQHALSDKLSLERQTLVGYLPQPLTDDELAHIAMRQHSIMNHTQIMTFLRQHYQGRYEHSRAAEIIRSVTS
jgi:uncharacterized protein YqeY